MARDSCLVLMSCSCAVYDSSVMWHAIQVSLADVL